MNSNNDLATTAMWDSAVTDQDAVDRAKAVTAATVALSGTWPFLAVAQSNDEFEQRLALMQERIESTVPSDVLTEVVAGLRDKFTKVHTARLTAVHARRTAARTVEATEAGQLPDAFVHLHKHAGDSDDDSMYQVDHVAGPSWLNTIASGADRDEALQQARVFAAHNSLPLYENGKYVEGSRKVQPGEEFFDAKTGSWRRTAAQIFRAGDGQRIGMPADAHARLANNWGDLLDPRQATNYTPDPDAGIRYYPGYQQAWQPTSGGSVVGPVPGPSAATPVQNVSNDPDGFPTDYAQGESERGWAKVQEQITPGQWTVTPGSELRMAPNAGSFDQTPVYAASNASTHSWTSSGYCKACGADKPDRGEYVPRCDTVQQSFGDKKASKEDDLHDRAQQQGYSHGYNWSKNPSGGANDHSDMANTFPNEADLATQSWWEGFHDHGNGRPHKYPDTKWTRHFSSKGQNSDVNGRPSGPVIPEAWRRGQAPTHWMMEDPGGQGRSVDHNSMARGVVNHLSGNGSPHEQVELDNPDDPRRITIIRNGEAVHWHAQGGSAKKATRHQAQEGIVSTPGPNPNYFSVGTQGLASDPSQGYPGNPAADIEPKPAPNVDTGAYGAVPPIVSGGSTSDGTVDGGGYARQGSRHPFAPGAEGRRTEAGRFTRSDYENFGPEGESDHADHEEDRHDAAEDADHNPNRAPWHEGSRRVAYDRDDAARERDDARHDDYNEEKHLRGDHDNGESERDCWMCQQSNEHTASTNGQIVGMCDHCEKPVRYHDDNGGHLQHLHNSSPRCADGRQATAMRMQWDDHTEARFRVGSLPPSVPPANDAGDMSGGMDGGMSGGMGGMDGDMAAAGGDVGGWGGGDDLSARASLYGYQAAVLENPSAENPTGKGSDEYRARSEWEGFEQQRPRQTAEQRNQNTPTTAPEPMKGNQGGSNIPVPGGELDEDGPRERGDQEEEER